MRIFSLKVFAVLRRCSYKGDEMLELISRFLRWVLNWIRYLYFLRFSLMLWMFALALMFLNMTSAKTLTSGIFVPEYDSGYICLSFFLVSQGFVALIIARLIAINGPDRFGDQAPPLLRRLLSNDEADWGWETSA